MSANDNRLTERPHVPPPIVENIPAQMIDVPRWIVWRYDFIDGRWTKIPFRADGRGKAKSNDPATWSTFDAANLGIAVPEGLPVSIQERAWSSPIWYTP